MTDDLLDCLLTAEQELEGEIENEPKANKKAGSTIHTGDTDSSDDEDNRDFQNSKYNDFGKSIKRMLNTNPAPEKTERILQPSWKSKPTKPDQTVKQNTPGGDVYTDPIFGIRITKPVISHATLKERMQGREAVSMAQVRRYIEMLTPQKDWVVAGALVHKMGKTSQKGNAFAIWTLSDLHGDLKTISLFLFGSAYKELWKCVTGTVVGILNPTVFEKKKDSKDEACLSVDNYQRVMIFGQSKDLGICKSVKKNGEPCTSFVNKNRCEFCIFHIKQEYQKCSKRSELQSNFQGRGLTALRNKVLGKNEVFYAGKSYTAIPAKRSQKLTKQDEGRLSLLSGVSKNSHNITKVKNNKRKQAVNLELAAGQRIKDMQLLKRLGGATETDLSKKTEFGGTQSQEVTLEDSKSTALSVIAKLKSKIEDGLEKRKLKTELSTGSDITDIKLQPTLKESKSLALDVISKLKAKKQSPNSNAEMNKTPNNIDYTNILDEGNLSDIEFNFSEDELENSTKTNIDENIPKNIHNLSSKGSQGDLKNSAGNGKVNIISNISFNGVANLFTDPVDISPKTLKVNKNISETTKLDEKSAPTKTPVNGAGSLKVDISPKVLKVNKNIPENKQDKTLKSNPVSVPKKLHDFNKRFPALGNGFPSLSNTNNAMIDLSVPIFNKSVDRAKLNALKWVQKNGPIQKEDPKKKKKRALEIAEKIESDPKKQKIQENEFFSDRFKKMMSATSKHTDLVQQRDDEEQEKYFNKLEMKERMEDKMMSTYKIDCKAVRCLQCKYTSFSASDLCKEQRHPLKVFDAVKRFFKCGDCGNRTVTLQVIPTEGCKNCGSGKWERTTMMKERKITAVHSLSIRGGEQSHPNSVITDANINLLVPDE